LAFTALDMAHVPDLPHLVFPVQPSGSIFVFLINLARLYGLPQLTFKSFWCLRASRKSLFKRFGISASDESHFPNGLAFPHLAKVISRMVWSFRAWRKSFPEWFGISAHGESRFPNGLAFPRLAKVVSRMVWHFRAGRKSFPEWFGISAPGESHFLSGLTCARIVYL